MLYKKIHFLAIGHGQYLTKPTRSLVELLVMNLNNVHLAMADLVHAYSNLESYVEQNLKLLGEWQDYIPGQFAPITNSDKLKADLTLHQSRVIAGLFESTNLARQIAIQIKPFLLPEDHAQVDIAIQTLENGMLSYVGELTGQLENLDILKNALSSNPPQKVILNTLHDTYHLLSLTSQTNSTEISALVNSITEKF